MRIAVGSDHRGYAVKCKIVDLLRALGQEVIDDGVFDNQSADYPDIAQIVAARISARS